MCAWKRLLLEPLESRDLFAIAEFTTQLYADDGGVPGETLAADEVGAGDSFFVEILAREFHPQANGLRGIALDLSWNPDELAVLDENVADTVTDDLPAYRGGTLDAAAGTITDLTGTVLLADHLGRPIGNLKPERFALLHMVALAPTDAAEIDMQQGGMGITTNPVLSLGTKDLSFVSPQIVIVSQDPGDVSTEILVGDGTPVEDDGSQVDASSDDQGTDGNPAEEATPDASGEDCPTDDGSVTDDTQIMTMTGVYHAAEDHVRHIRDLAVSPLTKYAREQARETAREAAQALRREAAREARREAAHALRLAAHEARLAAREARLAAREARQHLVAKLHSSSLAQYVAAQTAKLRSVVAPTTPSADVTHADIPVKVDVAAAGTESTDTSTDWSQMKVVVVGDIPMEEYSASLTAEAAAARPATAADVAEASPDEAAALVAAASADSVKLTKTVKTPPTTALSPIAVTTPSASWVDSIKSHWNSFRSKIFSFDWSPWVILLICLVGTSSAFAQEKTYYDPLEALGYRQQARKPATISRPLPPIRRSIATATEEDILAAGAEEPVERMAAAVEQASPEWSAERPGSSRSSRTMSRPGSSSSSSSPYRRAHYQEQIMAGDLNVDLPAEMQGGEYVYDENAPFVPGTGSRFGSRFGNFFGPNGGRNGAGPQNCGPLWVRGEYLLWWMDGFDVPALVTTAPAGTNQNIAGILGQAATSIAYGNEGLEDQSRSGGRATVGWWWDPYDTIGLQASYFLLDGSSSTFSAASPGTPIIARPFFNVEPGFEGQDAELIAYPGLFLGSVNVQSSSQLQGGDLLLRGLIATQGCWRVDGLAGYRYMRLKEGLHISDSRTVIGTNTGLAVGTTFSEFDQFNTSNEFHGGEVGVVGGYRSKTWTLEGTLKLAVGNVRQSVLINGGSTSSVPVVGGAAQVVNTPAGLLAQQTNIGHYTSDDFSVIPEFGLNVGYNFTPCLRGVVGYTFLYWTDVVRPGGQIDPNLNLSQLAVGGLNGIPSPAYRGVTDNLWVHGLSVGLDWQF